MDLNSNLEKIILSKKSNNNNVKSYRAIKKHAFEYPDIKLQTSVQIGTRIPQELKQRVTEFVLAKHFKLAGAYSQEITEMIEIGLSYKQLQTTTKTISLNTDSHRSDVLMNLNSIQLRLIMFQDSASYPVFHLNTITKTINDVLEKQIESYSFRGVKHPDKRTVRKYLNIILKNCNEESTSRFNLKPFISTYKHQGEESK